MAIFGNNDLAGKPSWYYLAGGYNYRPAAFKHTLSEPGTVKSITAYLLKSGMGCQYCYAIYSHDSTNNRPLDLIAQTPPVAIPSTGWLTINFATPVFLTAGTYWLAVMCSCDGAMVRTKNTATIMCRKYSSDVSWPTFPSSWTPTGFDLIDCVIYATYDPPWKLYETLHLKDEITNPKFLYLNEVVKFLDLLLSPRFLYLFETLFIEVPKIKNYLYSGTESATRRNVYGNEKYATRIYLNIPEAENIRVWKIACYGEQGENEYTKLGIYSDTNGEPDLLLCVTPEREGYNDYDYWFEIELDTPVYLTNKRFYWPFIHVRDTHHRGYVAGTARDAVDPYTDGPSDPFGDSTPSSQALQFRLFIKYDTPYLKKELRKSPFSEILYLLDLLSKKVSISKNETLNFFRLLRVRHYVLRGIIFGDSVTKKPQKVLKEERNLADKVSLVFAKLLEEALNFTLKRWIGTVLYESLTLEGQVSKFRILLYESLRIADLIYPGMIPRIRKVIRLAYRKVTKWLEVDG